MATPNTKKRRSKKKGSKTVAADSDKVPVLSDNRERFTFFFRKGSPFSQWHPVEFTVDGVEFNCAEQFMMYQKASK